MGWSAEAPRLGWPAATAEFPPGYVITILSDRTTYTGSDDFNHRPGLS